MASDLLKTMFLVVLMFCCFRCGKSDSALSDSLMISATDFVGLVRSTIDFVQKVIHVVQKYVGEFGSDIQLSRAVTDCLDLLDLSMDQLSWTISGSERPNGTGNVAADLKIWLSGALINQDTCIQGFDGTNPHTHHHFKRILTGSLDHITNLINKTLSNVKPPITPTGEKSGPPGRGQSSGRKLISDDKFPNWLRSHDRNLLQAAKDAVVPDAVVASDGTGNYSTIEEAIDAAPNHSLIRYVIYIKKGVYKEYIEMSKKKWNIMIVGDGANETIISGNRNFVDGWTTYRSATFAVKGQGFIARDITFENTAGPEKHQAVAFRSDSDLSVLYRCAIRGYQDTLYAHSQRQFYRECQITGTVDFIFGDGAVVFQNCQIQARQGLPEQKNTITAQGRKESVESTGFSIQFCNISVEPDVLNSTQTYLGRPWKLYSRTIIMQSHISSAIRPEGWLEWNESFALDTLFYAEYMNEGSGANIGARVKWPGYHVLNNSDEASDFTVTQFIIGNEWLPSTGVKYTAGLKA